MLVLLALLDISAAADETVTISGRMWKSLQEPRPDEPDKPPGPMVTRRTVVLTVAEDAEEIAVEATWQLDTEREAWFDARLAGANVRVSEVTWNGAKAKVGNDGSGSIVTNRVTGPTTLTLRGVVLGDATRSAIPIELLGAGIGTIEVRAGDLEPVLDGVVRGPDGRFWSGGRIAVRLQQPVPKRPDTRTLAIGHVGLGLTIGDAEATGQARLRWDVSQGSLDRVSFQTSNVGADLQVTGPSVRTVERSGDRVTVELLEPQKGRVELDARWTVAVPPGDEAKLAVPSFRLQDAWRSASTLQLARDGEVDVVPTLDSWEVVAGSDLPEWGEGLVQGTPTAAYRASRDGVSGGLGLLRFVPVSGPPTVIDTADVTAALTADGHSLMRISYAVRNERGASLRVTPPTGHDIVGVRVAGEVVTPVDDGQRGWLVPLQRSVETVEGLLSFTVEVVLLGEAEPWDKREERRIPLPAVDAEVAATRLTLFLPPEYDNRLKDGEAEVVDDFSEGEGITYGFAVGDTRAAEADRVFQDAVGAWMRNEFDEAQMLLDDLSGMGASNENTRRLQSNLDLLDSDKQAAQQDDLASRRVKEQAKARAREEEARRAEIVREAEEKELAGDYAAAESAYKAAYELGQRLEKLEQTESREVSSSNMSVSKKIADVKKKKKERKDANALSGSKGEIDFRTRTEIDFEDIEISGELVKPQGQLLLDRRKPADDGDGLLFDGGEEGGVVGGVIGGVVGGVLGGAVAGQPGSGGLGAYGSGIGGGGTAEGQGQGYGPTGGSWGDRLQTITDEVKALEEQVNRSSGRLQLLEEAILGNDDPADGTVYFGADEPPVAAAEPMPPEEPEPMPEPEPDMVQLAGDTAVTLSVERRRGPRVRVPNISIGGKKATSPPPKTTAKPKPASKSPKPGGVGSGASGYGGKGKGGRKADKSRGKDGKAQPLQKDFLERLPAGRSYQEAVQVEVEESFDKPLEVTAAQLSVVIPAHGERVRYQHLLLPPNTEHTVVVRARHIRRKK